MADSNLTIRIGSTGDFEALKQAREQTEMLKTSLEAVKQTLEAFGVSLGIGGLVEGLRAINEMAENIVNSANRLQISTEAFQVLAQVARQTGLSTEDMTSILGRLRGTLDTAAEGGGKAAKALEDLGLNAKVLADQPLEVALQAIALQVVNATDQTKAYSDAVEVLGTKNVPKLTQALKDLAANGFSKAKGSTAILSGSELEDIKETGESFKDIGRFFQVLSAEAILAPSKFLDMATNPYDDPSLGVGLNAQKQRLAQSYKTGGLGMAAPAADENNGLDAAREAIQLSQAANTGATARLEVEKEITDQKKMQLDIEKKVMEAGEQQAKARKQDAEEDAKDIAETNRETNEDIARETQRQDIIISGIEAQEKEYEKLASISMAAVDHDYTLTDTEKWEQKRAILEATVQQLTAYQQKLEEIANNPLNPASSNRRAAAGAQRAGTAIAGAQGQLNDMGPDPTSFYQNFSKDLTQLQNQWGTLQQNMASGLTGIISTGLNSVGTNIEKVIERTETWRKALLNIGVAIETQVINSFVQMGVKWIATQAMMAVEGKATAAASTAAMIPIAMAESEVWAAPAALATIASWGGAAVAAPELVLASMAATQALAGFASGGYTGDGSPGQVAGIVHGGEFVWSAPAVRNIGVDNLERAHTAAMGASPGAGGAKGSSGAMHSFHFHSDAAEAMQAALRSTAGRRTIVDIASRTVRQLT